MVSRKVVCRTMLSLLLISMLTLGFNILPVRAPAAPLPGGVDGEHYYQRHLWYAAGRWWLFYSNGVNAIYNSTTDGISNWVGGTLYSGVQHTQRIDAYYNGSHFHFVVADYSAGQPRYRLGEPQSDGTIDWAAAWQHPGGTQTTELSVTADSEGYPWICYNYNTEQSLAVTTSTKRDGTWSTRSGFPHNLDTDVDTEGRVVALNGTAVYAIWKPKNIAARLKGRLWNGTGWESVEDVTSSYVAWGYQFQVLGVGSTIYLTFREDSTGHAYFMSKNWGESWSSEYDISESGIVNTPSIIHGESGELWVLWGDSDAKIWTRYYNGTSWMPIRQVATEPVYSGGEACLEINTEVPQKCGLLFYGSSLYFDVLYLEPRTWTVDDDGPADFHTIQEAINAAYEGDTIFVRNGTYSSIQITKSLILEGESRFTTIIDGGGGWHNGSGITVLANNARISKFTIQHAEWVHIDGYVNMTFSDNIMLDNHQGIRLISTSGNVIVNNIINGNYVSSAGAIGFDYANNNIVHNNTLTNSGYLGAIHAGYPSYNNTFSENTIIENSHGIELNNIFNECEFFHNNFINNTIQVLFSGPAKVSSWDNGYPSGGNYWSNYAGVDFYSGPYQNETGSDGIGDVSYVIDTGNKDNYPLMKPWIPYNNGTIYIRADGSIDPSGAPILRRGDVYTLTGNVTSDADGIVIERNNMTLDGAGYTLQGTEKGRAIDLSSRSNVTIINTNIECFQYGIWLDHSSYNMVCENNATANIWGIWLSSSSNNMVRGNKVTASCYGVIVAYSSNNNTVCGNDATANNFHDIILDSSSNNTVCGNNATASYYGIWLFSSSNNIIRGNNATANNSVGIWLSSSSNNTISRNRAASTNDTGIFLAGSSNNMVCGNDATANGLYGIRLLYSSNNTIAGNNATANNYSGILLQHSDNNTFSAANVIANNNCGINLDSSYGNRFYHSNIINNNHQVLSNNSTNIWDDGYPSGGNYWRDYTGVDLYSGPYQNETGSDGLGDTPYVIDADNIDRYPLMSPWKPIETSVRVKGKDYPVTIVSNATIEQIVATKNTLHFKSSGTTGEKGYILVIFPMVNTTEIKVFIDGVKLTPPPFPVINTNGTHYFIYFEFTLSIHSIGIQFAPIEYTLAIESSPTEVTFSVDGVPHTTPWSATYDEDTLVSVAMPQIHTDGEARYYWNQWSDGITNRSRTVTMNTNITLTAYYSGPYYELTVTSSPIAGISFSINSGLQTTPYTQWLLEGSYTLEMPETHNGYIWSHWLEDEDTNRIKTINLPGTTWTGVFVPTPRPPSVGGYIVLVDKTELTSSPWAPPWIPLVFLIVLVTAISAAYVKLRKDGKSVHY